ncbi:hypothetical protein [Streptomyces fuscigenes]|uniref:hypothetical protein n=1 Tax=Streptomyces fuscigenes TaxID=1528880 RepID=UPI001F37644B|nr:hypothetical protein [Streptomyces fuscigenes]MCF3962119.1 hypothetical protein [Streptomyces fuscigenes]
MNTTMAGLFAGLALGFAGYFGGFGALVVVAVVGAAGLLVGYLARREGHLAGLLRDRDEGRDERAPHWTGSRSWRGARRTEPHESYPRPDFRERVH